MKKFFLLSYLVVSMPSVLGMDKLLNGFKIFTFTNKKVEFNSEKNNVAFSDKKEIKNSESKVSTKDTDKYAPKYVHGYTPIN